MSFFRRSALGLSAGLMLASLGAAATAEAADLEYFRKQLEPYRQKPEFVAPGPAFNAKSCMKDKTIMTIPVTTANPFTQNINDAMQRVANEVGFKLIRWENQGQPTQWAQGVNQAINQKVDLIDLVGGTDPRVMVPQVEAAKAAGIPVVASHYSGFEQEIPYATHGVPIDYFEAGQLLVDWAVVETEGTMNGLLVYSTGPLSTDSMMAGIDEEMSKCPDCKLLKKNVLVTEWATRLQPTVQSALLADPTINYIIVMYDSMSQFVVPAVEITGAQDRVKIDAFNGTAFVLGLVQQGKVQMDIGENLDWVGHAIIDAEMRILCGLEPVKDPKIPFYIFTQENAFDAGTPPEPSKGYGDAYLDGYRKLWGLK
jgi:ribose transport system substrate-binding protein